MCASRYVFLSFCCLPVQKALKYGPTVLTNTDYVRIFFKKYLHSLHHTFLIFVEYSECFITFLLHILVYFLWPDLLHAIEDF